MSPTFKGAFNNRAQTIKGGVDFPVRDIQRSGDIPVPDISQPRASFTGAGTFLSPASPNHKRGLEKPLPFMGDPHPKPKTLRWPSMPKPQNPPYFTYK